jgi:vacuolar protein sorting-associated protein IST1
MSSWFAPTFSATKCKPQLKMAIQRVLIKTNKEKQKMMKDKKSIAKLLSENKEEKARIRTEAVVRGDFKLEALDILSLLCELLHERMGLISSLKECPPDMTASIATLIWAAPRTEIPEFVNIAKLFKAKYGPAFFQRAQRNTDGIVNEQIINKLSVQPPNAFLVLRYMKAIAKANGVNWNPSEKLDDTSLNQPYKAPTGADVQAGGASGLSEMYGQVVTADVVTTGERVKCGSCGAILGVPHGVERFACSSCQAVLQSPSFNNGGNSKDNNNNNNNNDNNNGGGGFGGFDGGSGGSGSGGGTTRPVVPVPFSDDGMNIPMPPTNIPGGGGFGGGGFGGGGFGGGGGGGGGGIPDIPMPPTNIPGSGGGGGIPDIPMPPTNIPSSGVSFVNNDKSSEVGNSGDNDKYEAEARAAAAAMQNVTPVIPTVPDIPMPPTDIPEANTSNNNNNNNNNNNGGGGGGGGGVPDFDQLSARFAALQGN